MGRVLMVGVFTAFMVSVGVACDTTPQEFNNPVRAVLVGSVVDGEGSAVAGAEIDVAMVFLADRSGSCDEAAGWFAEGSSGADGLFELELVGPIMFSVHEGCVTVTATPPPGLELMPATLEGLQLVFKAAELVPDTIEVELVLPGP